MSILNYALTLEYVQATFYTEAEHMGALKGVAARAAAQIGSVERAHVEALRSALGSKAVARPSFDFGNTVTDGDAFLRTAVAFEDLATAAYKGQLPQPPVPGLPGRGPVHPLRGGAARGLDPLRGRPSRGRA